MIFSIRASDGRCPLEQQITTKAPPRGTGAFVVCARATCALRLYNIPRTHTKWVDENNNNIPVVVDGFISLLVFETG